MSNRIKVVDGRRLGMTLIEDEVFDTYGEALGVNALAVYCVLCRHANKDGECDPGRARIARLAGLKSEHSVDKALKKLAEMELIHIQTRYLTDARRYDTNAYKLLPLPKGGGASRAPGGAPHAEEGSVVVYIDPSSEKEITTTEPCGAPHAPPPGAPHAPPPPDLIEALRSLDAFEESDLDTIAREAAAAGWTPTELADLAAAADEIDKAQPLNSWPAFVRWAIQRGRRLTPTLNPAQMDAEQLQMFLLGTWANVVKK